MKINKIICLLIVNNWITINFGKNPKKGGNPPNESKLKNKINLKFLLIKNNMNNWLIWDVLKLLNIKIIEAVNNE